MKRFTPEMQRRWQQRRRHPRGRHAAVVLLASGAIALSGCAAPERPPEQTFAGTFSAGETISISNLTIAQGLYDVQYEMDVLVAPSGPAGDLTCGVVDTAGRIEFFDDLERSTGPGQWSRFEAQGEFDLPELTLAIQCRFDQAVTASVVVRNAALRAREL